MQNKKFLTYPKSKDLHDINLEKDSCGTGFIVNIKRQESYKLTQDAIAMLIAMDHRGGRNADPETGDGVGISFSIPHTYFETELAKVNVALPERSKYAAGNIFFPQDAQKRAEQQNIFESIAKEEGLSVFCWRSLKVQSSEIGVEAQACEPNIVQVFVKGQEDTTSEILERQLYLLRKRASKTFALQEGEDNHEEHCYICSLSTSTIVYKGMLTSHQLSKYYLDLQDPNFLTFTGMIHSRFSTNTFPSWDRAHPFRMMSHNGEINTLKGNRNKMNARQGVMASNVFKERLNDLYPVIEANVSDSGAFDNTLEFLYQNGYSLAQAVCMMIPEAWQHSKTMEEDKKSMYESFSCVMDPWDGPACITFTDGRYIGVVIDRNGLRPSRYYVTKDDTIIMASEFGVINVDPERVIKKDRLQPGKVFLIDTVEHRIIDDSEIKQNLASAKPYKEWIDQQAIMLSHITENTDTVEMLSEEALERISRAYGYSEEDKYFIIKPMIEKGKEPLGSMGNDVALACVSSQPRVMYDYFKQLFAQVTNPPIDSIRERNIMSIGSFIGPEGNLLDLKETHNHRLWVDNPILSHEEFAKIAHINYKGWSSVIIDVTYEAEGGEVALQNALTRICKEALVATENSTQIIILSDKALSSKRVAISSLMALASVHHYLISTNARAKSSLVVETGEAREVHHYCLLIGYGADAIFPYVALEHAYLMHKKNILHKDISKEDIIVQYKKAVDYGICKVFAKMGISTIDSYRGAQIFEAVGIGQEVINRCFIGTPSRIGGLGFSEFAEEARMLHTRGFATDSEPEKYGDNIITLGSFQWRKGGHKHMWDPESVALLQHAVRGNKKELFEQFAERQNQRSSEQATIRGLLKVITDEGGAIPIEEVEPAEAIMSRFASGAMSYGSISREAHETLAVAMNRIGSKSNTGEGGEIPERFVPLPNGDSKNSAIKQVASGRFGVTIEYLSNGNEIQIKMAQGAKPGEGGELPGKKVFGLIAKTRHATEGIELVSPPPHHDIYSIEDLAQLIYDLKNANPSARISVKLVAEVGVGVIAAGVCKAKADHILISGHDGGTGASPLTSVKHAGLPWELGIAETHQVLVRSGLRSRVVLQTDGQLKTGRDICIATMLGAEEFGFATSALIAMGCIMMRKCELNTCPVGIATQDESLRKKFTGSPEHVERLMRFIAEDTRAYMAKLGFRSIDEMVGRIDLLESDSSIVNWKSQTLDLSALLGATLGLEEEMNQACSISQNHGLESVLDVQLIKDVLPAVKSATAIRKDYEINNINRTTGTMLSHEVAKLYGLKGLPEDTIELNFTGHAGQSFGAFLAHGITQTVIGDGNDYVGKGLSGGIVVFVPPEDRGFVADENIIVGNVVLYGAVLGKAFFRGRAAERFCIRNSGVKVVVEGVGAHGCEYMTGGRVVVLGTVDSNFASGMSGGIAYVWNKDEQLMQNINAEALESGKLLANDLDDNDIEEVHSLIEEHFRRTNSTRAKEILENWSAELPRFVKVISSEYQRVLNLQRANNRKDTQKYPNKEVV